MPMRRTISLDGEWERRDFLDEAWRWSDALRGSGDDRTAGGPPAKPGISAGWRPAHVPGSSIDDAWRAGEIPNPYLDTNSLAAEWIPERTWLYRRQLEVPDPTGHAVLRFEGIDPGGTVFLDGEEVARHDGMFVPLEVDLSGRVSRGPHTLVVAVDPAAWMPSQVSRTELARRHHSRMGYGWDFCPRMIHSGIWRAVMLETYRARLHRPRLDVRLAPDRRSATVEASVEIDGDGAASLTARVIDPDGAEVASERVEVGESNADITLSLNEPRLWWPNGIGEQPIYTLELTLESGDGPLDERPIAFGFRSIETEPTAGATADALPYTLVVNGRPTWGRGWNWTPIDAAFGVPRPEKLRHLIELLRRANVNLLRVWGGGLIESDDFYEACDRAGIMVWQEFAQSSSGVTNAPADDAAFVDLMRREARSLVPLRAHHPSLAIWCGGNELSDASGRPLTDAHPVVDALHDVVTELDPTRVWLPTSPTGPRFDNSLAAVAEDPASLHDVHGPWEHQGLAEQHALANATTSLLHSEFGVEGMTNLPALRATVTDRERWTADRTDPVIAHRGAWWNNRPFVERVFGGDLTLDELERASQHLQADGLRTLLEGDRRRWPRNAGALPWVFNEPFPNAWSNAAVDYFGVPKAAYFAVAEAYAPILPGVSLDSQVLNGATELTVTPWLVNDTDEPLAGAMTIALHDAFGRALASREARMAVAANAVAAVAAVTLELPPDAGELLVLDTSFGPHTARRLLGRTDTLEPMRRLPPATLSTSVEAASDGWSVKLSVDAPVAAVELRLADARPVGWPDRTAWAYLDRNVVTLLPGERETVGVEWCDVPPQDRALRIAGWNVVERVLTGG